jgi:hypothetical protein
MVHYWLSSNRRYTFPRTNAGIQAQFMAQEVGRLGQLGGVAMICRAMALSTILIGGMGFAVPSHAEAWAVKGRCSKGNIAQSDGVPTGAANGMSGKDYIALMQRARAAHLTLGSDGFLWATKSVQCDSAIVWVKANSKSDTLVSFSNGDEGKPVLGFTGVPIDGDGPLFFPDSVYLGDGKPAMPINPNGNGQSCHFYFTDHGTFTHGWENRLTTIECNARVKGADGHLVSVEVRFDATQTPGSATVDTGSSPSPKADPDASAESPDAFYDPIPEAWSIKIGLPGTLSVGAEYCTQSGKCQDVGEGTVGLIQQCQETPDAEPCLKARIPVQVLASSPNGRVIVRLNGRNYAVGGIQWEHREPDGSSIGGPVSVIYQGASIPLRLGWQPGR